MKKKEWKLIVTFHTTADAMAMERLCKEHGMDGRLIPVPRSMSAGCGLAWCAPTASRDRLQEMMKQAGIQEEDMQECLI